MTRHERFELESVRFFLTKEEWHRFVMTGSVHKPRFPRAWDTVSLEDEVLSINAFDPVEAQYLIPFPKERIVAREETAHFLGITDPELALGIAQGPSFFSSLVDAWDEGNPIGTILAPQEASKAELHRLARLFLFRESEGLGKFLAKRPGYFSGAIRMDIASDDEVIEAVADLVYMDVAGPNGLLNAEKRIVNFLNAKIGLANS